MSEFTRYGIAGTCADGAGMLIADHERILAEKVSALEDRIRTLQSQCDAKDAEYMTLSHTAARDRDEKDRLIAMLKAKVDALKVEVGSAWEAVTMYCEASCVYAISSYVLAARANAPHNATEGKQEGK